MFYEREVGDRAEEWVLRGGESWKLAGGGRDRERAGERERERKETKRTKVTRLHICGGDMMTGATTNK